MRMNLRATRLQSNDEDRVGLVPKGISSAKQRIIRARDVPPRPRTTYWSSLAQSFVRTHCMEIADLVLPRRRVITANDL